MGFSSMMESRLRSEWGSIPETLAGGRILSGRSCERKRGRAGLLPSLSGSEACGFLARREPRPAGTSFPIALHYKPLGCLAELSLTFLFEQSALPVNPPAIPTQTLVLADNPVTRNHHRDRIRGAGSGNCAGCRWLTDGPPLLRYTSVCCRKGSLEVHAKHAFERLWLECPRAGSSEPVGLPGAAASLRPRTQRSVITKDLGGRELSPQALLQFFV